MPVGPFRRAEGREIERSNLEGCERNAPETSGSGDCSYHGQKSLMSIPVLTFFNNKGRVGKTSLVYHLAWMFSEMGKRVVAIDLDPQANLTSAFLPEE